MRIITWNLGGQTFKRSSARAWHQILAWDPDVALVQEAYPPLDIPDDRWHFTPYRGIPDRGTLIYSKHGPKEVAYGGRFHDAVEGQVTLAEVTLGDDVVLFASVHAVTDAVSGDLLTGLDTAEISSWGGESRFSLDLILDDLRQVTKGRRFVVGGDFNASIQFDNYHRSGSRGAGYAKWFMKARDARWRLAHAKFHPGDQRTLFRVGRLENFQLDHFFVDDQTWERLTACDVVTVPFLNDFTDHAPLVLEW